MARSNLKRVNSCLLASLVGLSLSNVAMASLVVNLSPGPSSGTMISISGSGGDVGSVGTILDFLNFSPGNPFTNAISSTETTFFLDAELTFNGANGASQIRLTNPVSGTGSDFNFVLDSSLTNMSYSASGSAKIFTDSGLTNPLLYSSFNSGSYDASTSVGDADNFGGVTLNIAVPEVSAFALGSLICCVVGMYYGGRRSRPGNI